MMFKQALRVPMMAVAALAFVGPGCGTKGGGMGGGGAGGGSPTGGTGGGASPTGGTGGGATAGAGGGNPTGGTGGGGSPTGGTGGGATGGRGGTGTGGSGGATGGTGGATGGTGGRAPDSGAAGGGGGGRDGGTTTADGRPPAAGTGTTTVIGSTGLMAPRDLAFNPRRPKELWVVSSGDSSVTIIQNAPDDNRLSETRRDQARSHFMNKPMAIAFGADETNQMAASRPVRSPGTFATCGDYGPADNFMGPVLWPSDLEYFTKVNGPLGSHIDMLHLSPLCTGIAWQGEGNIYWTVAGTTRSIVKYDFQKDHGSGNDDHSDGLIWRYAVNEIGYTAGVVSGLHYRPEDKMLYIADTGNGRVVKLDTESATMGARMRCADPVRTCSEMVNAKLTDVVPKGVLTRPSGLEIKGATMVVTDNATSTIHKFDLAGAAQGSVKVDVPAGGLGGITFGPDDKLYFVDSVGNRVLRLESPL
jgi:hypothetical protein